MRYDTLRAPDSARQFRLTSKMLIASVLMISLGFSFANYFDGFETYYGVNDPSFISKYTYWSPLFTENYNVTMMVIPSDSIGLRLNTSFMSLGGTPTSPVCFAGNESYYNATSLPFSYGFTIKKGSEFSTHPTGNLKSGFGAYVLNNYTDGSVFINSSGILALVQLKDNKQIKYIISRCYSLSNSTNINDGIACNNGFELNSSLESLDDANINYTFSENGLSDLYTLNQDLVFRVQIDTNRSIEIFINGHLHLSYKDSSGQTTSGSMAFCIFRSEMSPTLNSIYLDDVLLGNSSTVIAANASWNVLSYPEYSTAGINFYNNATDSKLDWVPLNVLAYPQFTFMTPVGIINQNTQITCPIYGNRTGPDFDYTIVPWLDVKPNTSSCSYAWFGYNSITEPINFFAAAVDCYARMGPYIPLGMNVKCGTSSVFNNTVIIMRPLLANSWNTVALITKQGDDHNYFFTGGGIVCTQPTKLQTVVSVDDMNGCAGVSNQWYYTYKNFTIGIHPDGLPCDANLNASCLANATNTTSPPGGGPPAGGEIPGTPPGTTTSDSGAAGAGITNAFDISQGGGLVNLFLSPIFVTTLIIAGISAFAGMYGGSIPALMSFTSLFMVTAYWGIYPLEIMIIIAVVVAGLVMYIFRDLFGGKSGGASSAPKE